jgi:transcriptional regulator with XRE-family HTH domain
MGVAGLGSLGARVRELREGHGLSRDRLSEMIGASRGYVTHLESGRIAMPSQDLLLALARELGTSAVDLLHAAGYLPAQELGPVEDLVDDPVFALALRQAAGVADVRIRQVLAEVIGRIAGLEERG